MSIYETLPDERLADFFVGINRYIEKGILSEAMYYEIELIKKAALKRELTELDLRKLYLKAGKIGA
ncbi:Uncharacterised protein [Bacillus freudenreichii]|nr:Uncharacterised protein [Bacillus freudenreichii]